ncbi:MAG: hypothetical protein NTW25_01645 [Candidatus Kapabacteria bacterium]|nr:hypothetical protein [Candidatus Kapabacteria bacterium]
MIHSINNLINYKKLIKAAKINNLKYLILLIFFSTLPIYSQLFYSTGGNVNGQIGDGTTVTKTSPTLIGLSTNWSYIGGGSRHVAAIKTDGTIWAWGQNTYGQIGDGTNIDKTTPTQIGVATTWVEVACGNDNTLAIKSDGTLWSWGNNNQGQLGDGTTVAKTSPIQVGVATNWAHVATGNGHTIALKTDGTLWAWGFNGNGQLGDGTNIARTSPVQIGVLNTWSKIACGMLCTVAIKTDGTLWAWGLNGSGQLGDGTNTSRNIPTQVGVLTTWASVSSGDGQTMAIKTDGTLWGWGLNGNSQLGDGTTTNQNTPIQIGAISTWSKVSCSFRHSSAIRTDGTLWAWGLNSSGQLGDGTTTARSTPTQIIAALTSWVSVRNGSGAVSSYILAYITPTLTTTAISSITGITASSGGNVSSDGGNAVTARGVCWNTSTSPTIANSKTIDGTGTGAFTSALTGLSLNTTYYVRAYATNSVGTSYGSEVSFTTLDIPTLTTTAISALTGATAISGGSVSNDGGASVTARGVVWNTSTSPTIALTTKTSNGTGLGAFVSSLTAMSYVTTYYVRAYATNSVGTAYGNEVSFITNASSVVRTMDVFYLTSAKAFVSGETISDSGVPVTASGVVIGTSTTPTIGSEDSVLISSGLSYFSRTITNLSPSAKYFIRTFSINTDGISYGAEAILYQPQGDIVTVEEAGAPNSGDGNNDGIPDYSQFSVSSMKNINNDYTTIASSGGHTLRTVSNYASPDKSAYTYPLGVYQFKITAQRDTVIMYFHNTASLSSYVYRKLNSQGKWVNYEKATFSTARIGGKTVAKVTLPLEDGEAGDADGLLNGEIDDPGGPAFLASPASIPVWDLKYVVLLMCMFGIWIYKSKIV